MTDPITISHDHAVLRVIQAAWNDATDASHSQQKADNRWNTAQFPALYCCCSEAVARAVALNVLRLANVMVEDLQPEARPALAALSWSGEVVDVISAGGLEAAGFPPGYPDGVSKDDTRRAATRWHERGHEGVVCRSASVWRLERGRARWLGPHDQWSEVAIFTLRAANQPRQTGRRTDLRWLEFPVATQTEP